MTNDIIPMAMSSAENICLNLNIFSAPEPKAHGELIRGSFKKFPDWADILKS